MTNLVEIVELLGQVIDGVESEHAHLPNEFTRGQVSGAQRAYAAVAGAAMGNEQVPEESIPFSTPPGMVKYGVPPDQLPNKVRSVLNSDPAIQQINELMEIKYILGNMYDLMKANNNNISEEAQKIFNQEERAKILDDIAREAQEAGDYELGPEDFTEHQRLEHDADTKTWNLSFGQRMRGQAEITKPLNLSRTEAERNIKLHEEGHKQVRKNILDNLEQQATNRIAELRGEKPAPYGSIERQAQLQREQITRTYLPGFEPTDTNDSVEEEYVDPETGYRGKQRRIGKRFNPDEDQPTRTVEEWESNKNPSNPNVYTARDNDELQDLGPGDE